MTKDGAAIDDVVEDTWFQPPRGGTRVTGSIVGAKLRKSL